MNHLRKQEEFFEGKRKRHYKNKPHIVKSAVEIPNLNITYQIKEKQRKKQQKNIKDIMIMMMMLMIMMMMMILMMT